MRLVDLADRTGLSASYLSQVEHNRICPSVVALGRIAQGLGVSVGAIFEEIDEGTRATWSVVRHTERKIVMLPNSPIRNELLVPNLQGALEVMVTKIPPGTKSGILQSCWRRVRVRVVGHAALLAGRRGYCAESRDGISTRAISRTDTRTEANAWSKQSGSLHRRDFDARQSRMFDFLSAELSAGNARAREQIQKK